MLILLAAASVMIFSGGVMLWNGPQRWVGLLPWLGAIFMLWILFGTYYQVDDQHLLIRSGPFWWTVRLETIQSITPTYNPLSSPALSLDRLWISYKVHGWNRAVMISPLDKQVFLQAVVERVPTLQLEGQRVKHRV